MKDERKDRVKELLGYNNVQVERRRALAAGLKEIMQAAGPGTVPYSIAERVLDADADKAAGKG